MRSRLHAAGLDQRAHGRARHGMARTR
jgi:hypothetical protein